MFGFKSLPQKTSLNSYDAVIKDLAVKLLKRLTLNHLDTIKSKVTGLESKIPRVAPAVDDLPSDLKLFFTQYIMDISKNRAEKKKTLLWKSLYK